MTRQTAIFWFRKDLRLDDNPALRAAVEENEAVIPVYLHVPDDDGKWGEGAATRVWLHESLKSLSAELDSIDSRLVLREGSELELLQNLVAETNASHIYWNRLYEPETISRDKAIKESLHEQGLEVRSFNGSLLYEPWEVKNKQGTPYKVYTPFWRALESRGMPSQPLPRETEIPGPDQWPASVSVEDLGLLPSIPWHKSIIEAWQPGEKGAKARLEAFLESAVEKYDKRRDLPGQPGTSRLSPHLHFGEISPRRIFHETASRADKVTPYLKQIVWREFAHHLLYHFPETTEQNLNRKFDAFPWRESKEQLQAWQKGQTGFPIVDAGMRELWHTGWMHNRVRMIVGSFLVKDLMIHWHEGARWFWDTLVDADLANNTMGWQWIAGSGADAAPYFRVFNPMTQGEKFDGEGDYIRQWVPELGDLPNKYLNQPWQAPDDVLEQAGLRLGKNYPRPVVDHAEARVRALDAYQSIRQKS